MHQGILDLVKGVCGPGTERNPFTRRCNKQCKRSYQRIRNPYIKTFRCYKNCQIGEMRDKYTYRCRRMPQSQTKSRTKSRTLSRFYRI
jgi:hypothetical protein